MKTKIAGNDSAYLWWNIPFKLNKKKIVSKTASGNGRQFTIVIPEMDLVSVFTGGAYNSQDSQLAFYFKKSQPISGRYIPQILRKN